MSKSWFAAKAARGAIPEISILSDIGEFGVTAEDFNTQLKALGPTKEILVTISSNGGDVSVGTAIYNMLKRYPAHKVVRVEGLAASMASVIAMAGDEIVMPGNAMMMIHNPWGGVVGEADQIISFGSALEIMRRNIVSAYASRTNLSESDITAMMDKETWLSAAEAVRLGFADRVEEPMRMVAMVNTSRFMNVPESYPTNAMDAIRERAFSNFNDRPFRNRRPIHS
jgi:ATP-dependent Clp protease protease subunit